MDDEHFEVKGIEELEKAISWMLNNYNNEAEKILKKVGNNFKKSVIEKTPVGTQKKIATKRLNKNYVVSAVQGDLTNKWIDIRSKSPHFHLLEKGHEITDRKGKPTGKRTKPVYMMKRTNEEYKEKYPEELTEFIEKFSKKAKKSSK